MFCVKKNLTEAAKTRQKTIKPHDKSQGLYNVFKNG